MTTTSTLSMERLEELARWFADERVGDDEPVETPEGNGPTWGDCRALIDMAMRTEQAESILKEWVSDLDFCCDLPGGGHRDSCLVGRTRAFLAAQAESDAGGDAS